MERKPVEQGKTGKKLKEKREEGGMEGRAVKRTEQQDRLIMTIIFFL